MMILKIFVGIVLSLMTTMAIAAVSVEKFTVREVAFGACHFKMADPYNGSLTLTTDGAPPLANYHAELNPKARRPFEAWIQFSCQNPVTDQTLSQLAGIKITDKGWALDSSPDSLGPPEAHTTFYPLHGKGWKAGGVTQDDINGDEDRRTRIYAFCIPHNKLALCGVVRDVAYLSHLDESILPQVIELLKSIEFIDTPISAPASSGTTAAPHP